MSPVATTLPRPRRRPDWRGLPPPSPDLEISVIVPVRDEARRLPATLRALAMQRDRDGAAFDRRRYEVIVLANNCSDASAAIVRELAARQPGLALHVVEVRFPQALAHVGHARASLMNEACRRLAHDGRGARRDRQHRRRHAGRTRLDRRDAGRDRVRRRRGGRSHRHRRRHDLAARARAAGPPRRHLPAAAQPARARHRPGRRRSVASPPPAFRGQPGDHRRRLSAGRRAACAPVPRGRGPGARAAPARPAHAPQRAASRSITSSRRQGRVAVGLSWQLREWAARAAPARTRWSTTRCTGPAMLATRRRLRELWLVRQRGSRRVPRR